MVLSGLFIVVFYSWASIVFSVGTLCGLLATGEVYICLFSLDHCRNYMRWDNRLLTDGF